jgi:aminomethyltransferase
MGRYLIRGDNLLEFFQKLVSKDLSKFKKGHMSGPVLLLNEDAHIIDDIMLYYLSDTEWLAVVNAPNVEKDRAWMLKWAKEWGYNITIEDITLSTTLIAIQGPRAPEVIEKLGVKEAESLSILEFLHRPSVLGEEAILVSKSGWTGEEVRSHGYEIMATVEHGKRVFEAAVKAGAKPAGLIARDSLRLEMGYPLIGVDIGNDVNPIEARYWMALSLKKRGFLGEETLRRIYREGVSKFRVAFKLKKGVRRIPRHGNSVLIDGKVVGYVTSGAYSPILGRSIGMGYIEATHSYIGFKVAIDIRGKTYEAKILDFPLI